MSWSIATGGPVPRPALAGKLRDAWTQYPKSDVASGEQDAQVDAAIVAAVQLADTVQHEGCCSDGVTEPQPGCCYVTASLSGHATEGHVSGDSVSVSVVWNSGSTA